MTKRAPYTRRHPGRGGHPTNLRLEAVVLYLLGYSREQIAQSLGVSQPAISLWWRDADTRSRAERIATTLPRLAA